ncbi:unnamed protein product [Peronospora destructor]|uniref:Uncharacterized protein n=1 Tax=Peronospora destructor TaxID=86335 RepID=A0AAV0TJG8_9STRA|nr:unnamed protein product [Peronospora destructor]
MTGEDGPTRVGHSINPPDPPDLAIAALDPSALMPADQRQGSVMKSLQVPVTEDPDVWTAAGTAKLRATHIKMLETDVKMTADMRRLYMIAKQSYPLHEDGCLREMTTEEREALSAYVERQLDLLGPPTFYHAPSQL